MEEQFMEAGVAPVAHLPRHLLLHLPPVQVNHCTGQTDSSPPQTFRAVLLNQENPECKKGESKLEGGGCAFTLYDSNGQPQSCTVNQKPEECDERSHHRQQFEKVNL